MKPFVSAITEPKRTVEARIANEQPRNVENIMINRENECQELKDEGWNKQHT